MFYRFIISIIGLLLILGCSKSGGNSTDSKPVTQVIDYNTKYSNSQNVVFDKPLVIKSIDPETQKILSINGKFFFVTSFSELQGTTFDYLRSFSVDTTKGALLENTSSFLGGYYPSGFPKSPFWYEDLNGDNIKDLFISDHGKETPSLMVNGQFPGFVCHLFLGNSNGTFTKGDIDDVTTTARFYHNSGVGDVDRDGKKDLVVQSFTSEEMMLFLNSNGILTKKLNITPNNKTGSVYVGDVDGDNVTDIISAPYIDKGSIPSTYIKKINVSGSTYSSTNISPITPFGAGFGCYKVFAIKNPQNTNQTNVYYMVENGNGSQNIFRSKDTDLSTIEDVSTIQNTYHSNGNRDFQVMDLNFDGFDDIFFYTNSGQNLNSRVWINNGKNVFSNPSWEVNDNLTGNFIPLFSNSKSGRTKFLYVDYNATTLTSQIIDVYTKNK